VPPSVAGNNQQHLSAIHRSQTHVLGGEPVQIGLAVFGKLDDLTAGGIEPFERLRQAGETAHGSGHLGSYIPGRPIRNLDHNFRYFLFVDMWRVQPFGSRQPAEILLFDDDNMFHTFQNRPSILRQLDFGLRLRHASSCGIEFVPVGLQDLNDFASSLRSHERSLADHLNLLRRKSVSKTERAHAIKLLMNS